MRVSVLQAILVVLIPSVSLAQGYSWQQEWYGGPGVPGPVAQWLETFDQSEGIAWWAVYPELGYPPVLELNHYSIRSVDENFESGACLLPSDFDNDGDNDLVASSGYENSIHWWENSTGTGYDWEEHSIDDGFNGCFFLHTGDIDGDGFIDVASAARFDDQLAWWKNPGTGGETWVKTVIQDDFQYASLFHLADIDGDGDLDAISSANGSSEIFWFENTDGLGQSWNMHAAYDMGSVVRSIGAADIDGDGDVDITVSADAQVSWLDNTGGTGSAWSLIGVSYGVPGITDIHTFDMDDDGDLDILGTKEIGYSNVDCWENLDGTGSSWLKHMLVNYTTGGRRIVSGDVDGDGDEDAVAVSAMADCVRMWENQDGTGTQWRAGFIQGGFTDAADVVCADINGDGIDDVSAISSIGSITCFCDTAYTESGWLESSIEHNPALIEYTSFDAYTIEPPGTSITFQLRISDDPNDMGEWSGFLTPPCDIHGMFEGKEYIQYRVALYTTDPQATPVLSVLYVFWDDLGLEEQPEEYALLGPSKNPGSGNCSAEFSLPCGSEADFTVFDMSGRICFEAPSQWYEPGVHSVDLPRLPPGVYILRMRAGEFSDSCMIVRVD